MDCPRCIRLVWLAYMNNTILKYAGLNAAGTALYIALVSTFLFNASAIFGKDREDTVLAPIAMLLLFVLSASTTGLLVLGRPIFWYLEGKKKESVLLLIATLGVLFLITVLAFIGVALLSK